MARQWTSRSAGAAFLALLISLPTQSYAADTTAVVVYLEDHLHLSVQDLELVKKEVAAIFRQAGVDIIWATPFLKPLSGAPCDGRRHIAVAIIDLQASFSGDPRESIDSLGRAAPATGRAWVFFNRIRDFAHNGSVDANVLLARVAAHEIGHLLIPEGAHADVGIMRASLEASQIGFFHFTPDQVKRLGELHGANARQCP